MERRLAAILAADIASYSLLVGRDEEGTFRAYKGHLSALEPIIGFNSGRLVKSTGDGFLVEFASVVDAVACAAAMQRCMAERNQEQPNDRQLQFRIGVHTGDVIVDGDDIHGDDVNIAVRLESIAEPGGVAVSERVYDDVFNKLDLEFESLGPRELKNIAWPVRVYALAIETPRDTRPALALPDKPSVAVLPFENFSSDAEQEYFADGITEDIIMALSHIPWIFVIARNSSFSYKGLAADVRKIGRELGVRYVLEGSVRRAGDRLRVTGQLIDAGTGVHIWAERYEGRFADVFDLQDRVTEAVVGAIAPEIRAAEIARVARKPTRRLDAYDHYLRALSALNRSQVEEARRSLDAALEHQRDYAKAKALSAWCLTTAPHRSADFDPKEIAAALRLAREAIEMADEEPEACAYAGYTLAFFRADVSGGLAMVERALDRCPSFAWAWVASAILHLCQGRFETAIERCERALRLSPRDPMAFRAQISRAFANLELGNFGAALDAARRVYDLNQKATASLRYQAASLAHLGRQEDAERVARRLLELSPDLRLSKVIAMYRVYIEDPEQTIKNQIEGLRMAGLPD
ncbi:MAG: adenylate/guanylate cyclase domain-containing protein [Kiloniellales bacterium]|nr:adenylate/guanylate cyclase domain-containing protein [Kiloniellales bacterium]